MFTVLEAASVSKTFCSHCEKGVAQLQVQMSSIASKWLSPDLQGCRVLLRMGEGGVEGVVSHVSQKTSRITLEQIKDATTKEPLFGTLHFYAHEISSCVVLDNTTRKKYILERDEDGPRLLRVRPVPSHLEKLNAGQDSCEFICHREETDSSEVIKKGVIKLIGAPDALPKLQRPIATGFEVIDEVNDQLSEAIKAIEKEQSISVAFEGVNVGRHGSLSVLAVATSSKVYVFDVKKLKKELFNQGLKEIFESDDIEKVIHGCRLLSDCLHHQYQVGFNNVFDTMVADVIIYLDQKLETGGFHLPSYVRGLQNCLRSFLNFTYDHLKYTRSRRGSHEDEVCAWGQRPLSLRQIDALVKDVVYLGELARACLKQMLQKFLLGVEYFLDLDRGCSEEELQCLPPQHKLPMGFRDALKLGGNCAAPNKNYYNGYDEDCHREYGRNGKKDNRHYQHRGIPRRGGRGIFTNNQMYSKGPEEVHHQEEYNNKQDESTCVKDDDWVEDSLLYIAMHQQKRGAPEELAEATSTAARESSSARECRNQIASAEAAKPSKQEKPATSSLQDHCLVVNENKQDARANHIPIAMSHLNTSPRSLEHNADLPAPHRSSMAKSVSVPQQTLLQHGNGIGPLNSSPCQNVNCRHSINVVAANRSSDDTPLALPATLMKHCNGSIHSTDSAQDKPSIQTNSQSLPPPLMERHQSSLVESTAVPAWDQNSNTATTGVDVTKKLPPKSPGLWGNRPINKVDTLSFRPADMKVMKGSG